MASLPPHLLELEELLLQFPEDSEALLLSGVDGLLAAVALSPDPIPPEDWMGLVADDVDPATSFDDAELARIQELFVRHAADVRAAIARDLFEPIYAIDSDEAVLWEAWMDGFHRGLSARGEAWEALAHDDDPDVAVMFGDLGQLVMVAIDPDYKDYDPELIDEAEAIIPELVAGLHALRVDRIGPLLPRGEPVRSSKVGRNDVCPCGSGKKYKKCCGAAA
ncbi:UPF0149 family protein [Sphingomonas sanxanigenens]|uniref:YecA family protein n=1 Tax=Sphingomonas sanxanigenens DSM 19645 = NX02 TaxID=1123269 RepID=W0A8B6_9SPHN|nr:UPF0149 family protein [Sphingomonas sanxanigenens]AHE52727.1 hypothetical protein NX02_04930 [Sphingomonas sanxanigenens DSM 19645 = NX02]